MDKAMCVPRPFARVVDERREGSSTRTFFFDEGTNMLPLCWEMLKTWFSIFSIITVRLGEIMLSPMK
jgi:hypothetical protein